MTRKSTLAASTAAATKKGDQSLVCSICGHAPVFQPGESHEFLDICIEYECTGCKCVFVPAASSDEYCDNCGRPHLNCRCEVSA